MLYVVNKWLYGTPDDMIFYDMPVLVLDTMTMQIQEYNISELMKNCKVECTLDVMGNTIIVIPSLDLVYLNRVNATIKNIQQDNFLVSIQFGHQVYNFTAGNSEGYQFLYVNNELLLTFKVATDASSSLYLKCIQAFELSGMIFFRFMAYSSYCLLNYYFTFITDLGGNYIGIKMHPYAKREGLTRLVSVEVIEASDCSSKMAKTLVLYGDKL